MSETETDGNFILTAVSSRLKDSAETTVNRVIDMLVEKEVTNRVELLGTALEKLKTKRKELDKLRPDIEEFSAEGEATAKRYSKARFEERKKAMEGLTKLENAIKNAMAGRDWDKLAESCK